MVTLRVLLTVAILIAFGNAVRGPFHYDDYSLFSPGLDFFPSRPLTYLTFWLNELAGGRNPLGYHAVNLALHLGASHLLLTCLRRLIPPGAAVIATFLFALHPIQTEPVAYIFARSTVLATFLCLVALWFWLEEKPWISLAVFALALLAKEECAAFPALLYVLPNRKAKPIAAMFGLSVLAVARVAYLSAVVPGSGAGPQAGVNPLQYLATQGYVILRYFQLLALPIGFSVDPDIPLLGWAMGAASWAALGLLVYIAHVAGSLRWFLGGLLLLAPTSSIFPAADLAADRRMYLPLIAFSAFAGLVLYKTPYKILLHAAAAVLIMLSFARTEIWSSEETLWEDAMRQAPKKVRPRIQLARVTTVSRAEKLLNEAKTIAPEDPLVASELGRVYMSQGKASEALGEFGRGVALDPNDPRMYNNRGVALCTLGLKEQSLADFRKALAMDASLNDARTNLARCTPTSSAAN